MHEEARLALDKRDFRIFEKPLRLFFNRFRWTPGGQTRLGKKVSDFGAKSVEGFAD